MTSLVGDGDLLLQDDLLAFPGQDDVLRLRAILFTTEDGGVANMFGIGPAILHSTYLWPSLRSSPEVGQSFRIRIGLASMALLAIVAVATRTLLVRLGFGEGLATICSLGSIFWGPLAIYGTRLYLNSHLPSAVCASLVALLCWDWVERGGAGRATLIGFCCGLAAVVRFQDALLGLAMAPFLLLGLRRRADRRRALIELALAAATFALVVSVQVLAFDRQSGRIFGIPQGPDFMRWTQPQLGRFLLSPYHGLVPWTPVFALGLLALPLTLGRADDPRKRLFLACLLALVAAQCYVSAATWDWAGGSSFSARRLSSVSMAAAVGLATLLSLVRRRVLAAGLIALASAWALVAASLFVANIDDLNLLLHGTPSNDNPLLIGYPPRGSLGPLDFVGFARGSFSLVDPNRPSLPHRAIGLGLCLLVCAGVVLAWRVASRYPRLPALIAASSVAWACFWWLAVWRAPSNAAANRVWRQVATGTASDQALTSLPPEIAAAGRVVLGWKALRRGQIEDGRQLLSQSQSPQFPPLNLVDLALLDEVRLGMPTP
ncbi:MAG TPA: hypothetical protein VJU18_06565 [Vicinamibacteria bacterium]|nr:hypothetical protein [Vicinamibacteria bacterium]